MSRRTAGLWILLFVALAIAGGALDLLPGDSSSDRLGRLADARVVRVVDGDTVQVRTGRRTRTVRYIGVDTPESVKPGEPVQCYAKAASAFNRRLVTGRRVRLVLGRERFDRYGRLLAYVFLTDRRRTFVNAVLIERGFARTLEIPPNTQRAALFRRLERRARRARLGLWSSCPEAYGVRQ
jgi:micrococcal nuclease